MVNELVLEDETLRDGLQIESRIFPLEEKARILGLLIDAGLKRIQLGSFVHPAYVPQMKDTDELMRKMGHRSGVQLTGLILNRKGLERALDCGLTHLSMGASVSNAHSLRNVNRPAKDALENITTLIRESKSSGVFVRAGVQCAFGCVYEGEIPEHKVLDALEAVAEAGADELNLADTTGMGNPLQVRRFLKKVKGLYPEKTISLHLHDTRGLGLANMLAGYEEGVRVFDVCVGGLGGCPFVKGAAGNVPTEDAVNMFNQIGVETGIDLQKLCTVVDLLESLLKRPLPGRMNRVVKAGLCQQKGADPL